MKNVYRIQKNEVEAMCVLNEALCMASFDHLNVESCIIIYHFKLPIEQQRESAKHYKGLKPVFHSNRAVPKRHKFCLKAHKTKEYATFRYG